MGREEFASEGIVTCEVEFEPLVCGMYFHFVSTHHAFRPNGRKAIYNTEIAKEQECLRCTIMLLRSSRNTILPRSVSYNTPKTQRPLHEAIRFCLSAYFYVIETITCGQSLAHFRARIIGGQVSQRGLWPWQIALYKGK